MRESPNGQGRWPNATAHGEAPRSTGMPARTRAQKSQALGDGGCRPAGDKYSWFCHRKPRLVTQSKEVPSEPNSAREGRRAGIWWGVGGRKADLGRESRGLPGLVQGQDSHQVRKKENEGFSTRGPQLGPAYRSPPGYGVWDWAGGSHWGQWRRCCRQLWTPVASPQ